MGMINNCNPRGPFNTPLDESGNLVFTQEIHGINAVLNFQEYLEIGLNNLISTNMWLGGQTAGSEPDEINQSIWPIIVDDNHPRTGGGNGLDYMNNTRTWHGDNNGNSYNKFCSEPGRIGWTLARYLPFNMGESQPNDNQHFTIPYQNFPTWDRPNRTEEYHPILRHMKQFYDFSIFSSQNLNESYDNFFLNGTSNFFTGIDSNHSFFDGFDENSYQLPYNVFYWVKVGCVKQYKCRIKLIHPVTGGILTRGCICRPDIANGESANPGDTCFTTNDEVNHGGCFMPSIETGAYDSNTGYLNFNDVACVSTEEGGLSETGHRIDVSNYFGIDYVSVPLGNQSADREHIYTDEFHPAYDYKVGCPQLMSPFYNSSVCFYGDDINELGQGSYSNIDGVCPTEDCNGTDVLICMNEGCSVLDQCGQCVCGGHAQNTLLNNPSDTQYFANCLLSPSFVLEENIEINEEYISEECYQDINQVYCLESQHDGCNVCSGDEFEHEFDSDDLGCGCFADPPTWFFLDRDRDCETNYLGIVTNPGGEGDSECDVYSGDAKLFCRGFGSSLTNNTCNYAYCLDCTAGQPTCYWRPFNPYNYVDCNIDDLSPSEFPFGLEYPVIGNEVQGSCYFDPGNDQDEELNLFEAVQGCMDENASNYNPDASFGIIEQLCEYEYNGEELREGDIIFRLNYNTYIESISLDLYQNQNPYINIGESSYQMNLFETGSSIFMFVLRDQLIGSLIDYNYSISTGGTTGGGTLLEGITRTTLVKRKIPTYVDVDYFNKFTDNIHKTNLPILAFNSKENPNTVTIIKDEIDEVIDINSISETNLAKSYSISFNEDFTFYFYKQDINFSTNTGIDFLGMDNITDWYIDELQDDKTLIKTALGLHLSKNMNDSYFIDNRFIESYYYSPTATPFYKGINILREEKPIQGVDEDNNLYNIEDNNIFRFDNTIRNFVNNDGNIIDNTLELDDESFVDFYILNEVMGNLHGIETATLYIDGSTIKAAIPTSFNKSFLFGAGQAWDFYSYGVSYAFYNMYPFDISEDENYQGILFNTLQYYSQTTEGVQLGYGITNLYQEFLNKYSGSNLILSRYNELRGSILNIDNILKRIDYYYDYLKNTAVFNNQRWRYFDYDNYENYDSIINEFKKIVSGRINYLDKNLGAFLLSPTWGGGEYCNDPNAQNYNSESNFNDGQCEYYSNRKIKFEVDMSYVNHPPIERVEFEIITKNNKNVLEKFDMTNVRNDIWEIELDVELNYNSQLQPGQNIEYHFIKHTPQVYSVETGAIEKDKSRFHTIGYEKETILSHYFNDYVDTLNRTNLPIIKIDTINYNDFGIVNENNKNLYYCPGYINPNSPVGEIEGYDSDSDICNALVSDIEYYENYGIQRINQQNGYYDNKLLCEQITQCETDCIDGTNVQDEPKITGFMDLIYDGENTFHTLEDKPQLSTKVGIEVRGFSSRGFPKKQYAVELQESYAFPQCNDDSANHNLFCNGFTPEEGEETNEDCIFTIENDFVLLGPYRDRVYVRNAMSYELSKDMGNPASNTKHFEFYLNDVYQGIFVMFERPKIDEFRMDVGTELSCTSLERNPGVHITELMFKAEPPYDTGDFIKIQNNFNEVINVNGWKVSGWGGEFTIPNNTNLNYGDFIVFVQDVNDFTSLFEIPSCLDMENPINCYYDWGSGGLGDDEFAILEDNNGNQIDNISLGALAETGDCISGADDTGMTLQIIHPECVTTTCNNFLNDIPTFASDGNSVPGENSNPEEICSTPINGELYTYETIPYDCYGGYIIKVESGGEQEFFIMDDGFTKIEYYDPKSPSDVEKEFIRDKVLTSIYDVSNRLDQNSFTDYVISQELAKNNEGYTRSQYWYVKDDEPNKFYMGYVWDFNHSFGAVRDQVFGFAFKDFFAVGKIWAHFKNTGGIPDLGDLSFLAQSENREILYDRWSMYRNGGILDINNLNNRINNLSAELQAFDSISRDNLRWFYSNNQDYETEFSFFKTWLFHRISWMDKWMHPNNFIVQESGQSDVYSTSILKNNSFNDDYPKTFIVITSPETNKVYDSNNTLFIKFSWVTSLDLAQLSKGFVYNPNDFAPVHPNLNQDFESRRGDNYLQFNIVNDITGEIVHTFSSNDFFGRFKSEFPEYTWNISDTDDISGSYYIQARYIQYEGSPFINSQYFCTANDIYTTDICNDELLNEIDQSGFQCLEFEPFEEDEISNYMLFGDTFHVSGIIGCNNVGDIIEADDYIEVPNIIQSERVYFSIQNQSEQQGCTDPFAINFDIEAIIDDASCKYQEDCDEKYILQRTDVDGLRTFKVDVGYNILSYPYPFASENISFFDVLNASYFPEDVQTFEEYDGVTAHFEGNSYSAVFINGEWKSTNTKGFNINNIKPGMGIILELQKPGFITWTIPESGRLE